MIIDYIGFATYINDNGRTNVAGVIFPAVLTGDGLCIVGNDWKVSNKNGRVIDIIKLTFAVRVSLFDQTDYDEQVFLRLALYRTDYTTLGMPISFLSATLTLAAISSGILHQ